MRNAGSPAGPSQERDLDDSSRQCESAERITSNRHKRGPALLSVGLPLSQPLNLSSFGGSAPLGRARDYWKGKKGKMENANIEDKWEGWGLTGTSGTVQRYGPDPLAGGQRTMHRLPHSTPGEGSLFGLVRFDV